MDHHEDALSDWNVRYRDITLCQTSFGPSFASLSTFNDAGEPC